MRKTFLFFIVLALTVSALAKQRESVGKMRAFQVLKSVIHRYEAATGVKCKIKRTVTISLLDQTKVSKGELSLSQGRVRVDLNAPDPATIVFDKSLVWVVTPTPKELGGRTQVLKMKSTAIDRESQAPIALLLGNEKAWDLFKVSSQKREGHLLTVSLEKKKPSAEGIQTIELRVDTQKNEIEKLSYSDDLENETSFKFNRTDFGVKMPNSVFDFVPPKNAEITVVN